MKAAVIGSKVDKNVLLTYEKVRKELELNGVQVDFSFFSKSLDDDYKDLESTHERNQKVIKTNDFIVAEMTNFSSGIGYLVANTLNLKKPVLVLYNTSKGQLAPNAIKSSAIKSKLLKYIEYNDDSDLTKIISAYVKEVKKQLDSKFILIISPQIDRYLEWASVQKRMHKAQLVRNAVEDIMEKDKEWRSYKTSD